jgi:gas vesicle protein
MKKKLNIPLLQCDQCKNEYNLIVETEGIKLNELYLDCKNCDQQINILEKTSDLYNEQKERLKPLLDRLTKLIIEAKDHVPKNQPDLQEAIKNPRHPFTAAVITAIVILLMELSGFGIFMILTWILGNLILNPMGWVIIPSVVAIVFTHRESLKNKKIKEMGKLIKDLEEKLNNNEIDKEEFDKKRDEIFKQYFN